MLTDSLRGHNSGSFFNALLEPESGRFRPGYWLYLWGTFLLGGVNPLYHHIFQLVIFILCAYLVYYITKNLFENTLAGIVASIFFAIDWRGLENWYRLGTQEPSQLFFLLMYLFFYLKSREKSRLINLFIAFVFLVSAVLIKETTIAIIGVALFIIIYDFIVREEKKLLRWDIVNFVFVLLVNFLIRFIALKFYIAGGYASLYKVDSSIFRNLLSYLDMISVGYAPVLIIVVISFLTRFSLNVVWNGFRVAIKKYKWQFFWLSWFLSFLVVQIPWGITMGRYLLIAMIGLYVFISSEVVFLIRVFKGLFFYAKSDVKKNDLKLAAFTFGSIPVLFLVVVWFYQIFMSWSYILWVVPVSKFNVRFIESINSRVSDGSTVILNADGNSNPPIELFYEIGWHLKYLFNNSTSRVVYASEEYSPAKGDLVVSHTGTPLYTESQVLDLYRAKLQDSETIDFSSFVIASPLKFIKNLPAIFLNPDLNFLKVEELLITSRYSYSWKIYSVQ